jgi:hypothetical protein
MVAVLEPGTACEPHFLTRMLEVMVNSQVSLCQSPQQYCGGGDDCGLYGGMEAALWEQWLPGLAAWGVVVCTGGPLAG